MSNPTVLLANEAGGGRGHVTLLAGVAAALGRELTVNAAIPSLRHAGELASANVTRGPFLRYSTEARRDRTLAGNASWGDYLAACGLASAEIVRAHLRWWRRRIIETDAAILVADYAPLALWAARGLKAEGWEIEVLSVGTGYGLPPSRLERFPQLLPGYDRRTTTEADTLTVLNAVAVEEGLPPLPTLPTVARADHELAFTLAYLDPYSAARDMAESFVPILTPLPAISVGAGTELFVYFSRRELDDPDLVEAISDLDIPRRGYFPGAPDDTLDRLRQSGMIVETAALTMADITARSRLVLGAGQHGLQCLAALAGLPQVAVPQHLEQLFHCRRSSERGILRHAPFDRQGKDAITALILDAWCDSTLAATARTSAQDLRPDYPRDPGAALARHLAPVVDRARQAYR